RFWEAPQGAWEERPDAPIEELAAGELREETGLVSHRLSCLGHVHLVPGYSNQACWVFLASELESAGETRLDQEEEGLISRAFPVETFEAMIASGEVKDSTTLCAYGLAKAKGAL
ncbi:MAG: NUDIX hydrolase, partial [Pseudomonadota bacterium]